MAFEQVLADAGMNFTLNRVLSTVPDGERAEILSATPRMADFASWHEEWLALAIRAEHEERWSAAAAYYHQADFYLEPGPHREQLYESYARCMARTLADRPIERARVPYGDGYLPAYRLVAEPERAVLVVHGGYDSFVEEFLVTLGALPALGYTVIAFDGPGQGGALHGGLAFTERWEEPAAAVLDHFGAEDVDWLGISWGGLLAIRAAAHEPRIARVVAHPAFYDGLALLCRHLPPGQGARLRALLTTDDVAAVDELLTRARARSTVLDWALNQGMHITRTSTPHAFAAAAARHTVRGTAELVRRTCCSPPAVQTTSRRPGTSTGSPPSSPALARSPRACSPTARAPASTGRWAGPTWSPRSCCRGSLPGTASRQVRPTTSAPVARTGRPPPRRTRPSG